MNERRRRQRNLTSAVTLIILFVGIALSFATGNWLIMAFAAVATAVAAAVLRYV
jgi:uncharacterized membrane protein YqgA involved in biofilm formation